MTLAERHSDNLGVHADLLALPRNDGGFPKLAPVEENVERHNEFKVACADVHAPTHNDIFWHFGQKGRQSHTHALPPRAKCIGPEISIKRNDLVPSFRRGIGAFWRNPLIAGGAS